MKSRLFLIIVSIFLLFPLLTIAQRKSSKAPPITWGELSASEINMKYCPFDSGAAAVVLSDFGEWKFKPYGKNLGYKAILNRHVRVKILGEAGVENANGKIPYVNAAKFEKLSGFKAQTINIEDGEIEYYPIEKDGKGEEDIQDVYTEFNFAFPRVKIGSILEYTYTFTTGNIYSMQPWTFQNDLPTMRSEVRLHPIKNLEHNIIQYYVKSDPKMRNRWVMENIPALVEEPFVNNMENYRAKITFDLRDYEKLVSTAFGFQRYVSYFYKSWTALANHLSVTPFTDTMAVDPRTPDTLANHIKTLQTIVTDVLGETTDSVKQVQLLYNFVRDSLTWDGELSITASPRKAHHYLKEGTGNSAQINMTLHQLLALAGIKSTPMLIGTIDHGLPILDFPVVRQFNQIIILAETSGKTFLLNAIDSLRPYDFPALNDLALGGFLLDYENSQWVSITNNFPSDQQVVQNVTLFPDGKMVGKVKEAYKGYYALAYRNILCEEEDEAEFWKAQTDESLISTDIYNQQIKAKSDPEVPLEMAYDMSSSDFSDVAGDYIYFKPLLDFASEENPFIAPERKYDVDMGCLHKRKITTTVQIPEGYEVESLPEPTRIVLLNKSIAFQYSISQNLNQIQVQSLFQTAKATFSPEEYPALKELYDHMLAKQSEQVVLRKKL